MATVEKRRAPAAGGGLREALLLDLPVTERRLEVAGIETALLEGGEGPPVVLLHGPGEFAATWLRVIPQLAETHRVVAPDLPGHGASGLSAGPLDAERALAWLGELIERTCDSPPALVGHLLGGSLAARFAADNGNRVSRLVLVDGYGLAPLRPTPSFAFGLIGFMARPTERSQRRLMHACMNDLHTLRERMDGRLEELEAYALERARSPAMKKALRALMPQLGMRPIPAADLERITVPTTLIWGRHDLQVRLRVAEAASARHGWPLHVIEDAADDPAVEQPEAFLDALEVALAGFDDREQRRTT
ncbi:MAG TPA: alpha/beta fold hydrolase [Gaiellaceae bacterium]|nr:alpha/beta fold hydrolase [Gaiellaceae bacterium]